MKSKIVKPKNLGNSQNNQIHSNNYTNLLSASQQLEEARATLNYNKQLIQNEELFDTFIENSLVLPLNKAFEPQVKKMFHSERCVLWIDQPEKQILFSPTYSLTAGYSNSLPGFIFKTKNVIQVRDPSQAPGGFQSDLKIATPNSPQLFFPITTLGTVRGVVQVVKKQGSGGFSENDMQITSQIMRKFSIYGDSLFTSRSLSQIALSLYSGTTNKTPHSNTQSLNQLDLIQNHFHCQKVELFHFDTTRMIGQTYDPSLHEMIPITSENNNDFGLVGFSVTSQTTINCNEPKNECHFSELFDSEIDGPLLVVSAMFGKRDAWAVALRGRAKTFSTADESQLSALLPFLVRSIAGFSSSEEQSAFNTQLAELLDVAAVLTSASSVTTTRSCLNSKSEPIQNSIVTSSDSKSELLQNSVELPSDSKSELPEDSAESPANLDGAASCLSVISTECVDVSEIAELIEEKAASLMQCEKALFYMVDNETKELVSLSSQRGRRRFPITKGIAGQTATEKATFNLTDPSSNDHFSPEIDSIPGYTPKSLLSAPIYDKDDVAGVLLLLTKSDGSPFDANDTKILKALNVFASISLQTSKLYQTSVKATQRIRAFVDQALHTSAQDRLVPLLEGIIGDYQTLLNSARVSLFVADDRKNGLELFVSVGKKSEFGVTFSMKCFSERKSVTFTSPEIKKLFSKKSQDGAFSRSSFCIPSISDIFDEENSYMTKSTFSMNSKDCEKIVCVPLFNKENVILGVLEVYYSNTVKNEIDLIDSLAEIATFSLEKIDIKQLYVYGYGEIQLNDWISEDEKKKFTVPEKLKIDNDSLILTPNFDVMKFDGIGLFKVIFFTFSYFDLMEPFNITNELLFNFLSEVKRSYDQNSTVSHNFRHAVSCTQFLTYMVNSGEIQKIIPKEELLVLVISSICHDVSFDFDLNTKSIQPYKILFKKGSYLETKSCTFSISILSKEKCNLLRTFSNDEVKLTDLWSLLIQLIISTDMSLHFTNLEEMTDLVSRGEFDIEEKREHRVMLLISLMMCADLSSAARPFVIADREKEATCERFFMQGDVEKLRGQSENDDDDRSFLKKIVAFYETVCLQLFDVVAKVFAKLESDAEQVKRNVVLWRKEFEKKE